MPSTYKRFEDCLYLPPSAFAMVVVVVVVVLLEVRAPLFFDARFAEYAAVENTGLRSELEDQGSLELGAGNPCFWSFD